MPPSQDVFMPYSYRADSPGLNTLGVHHTYVSVTSPTSGTHWFFCGQGCSHKGTHLPYLSQNAENTETRQPTPVRGDLDIANKIARPDSNCGITFGVNGCCQQRVNRLLWCCEGRPVLPPDVPGNRQAVTLWGHYGYLWSTEGYI